uniref:IgGFc-binding protein N-terminal domain-containing protein n=1 Tax=Amphimedon queenslandica TaxID=400682 RepID=A0A1X7T5D1_AMPQE
MTDTSEGNKFCFSFLKNKGTFYTKNLGIYIGTQESEPVQYRIRSGVSGVNRTGTVQPGEIRKEVYKTANMTPVTRADARSVNDFTGIIVETVNSSQKISIMGFSDAIGSSDGFTAVPIFNVSSIVENYTYSVFTGGPTGSDELALAAIVACDHITTGGVTLLYPQVPELDFLNSSNGYFQDQFFNAPNPSRIDFEQYYTPIIARNTDEAIADNGVPLEADVSKWSAFYCDNITDVCGYGVSIDIVQGPHLLVHTDTTCSFSAVLFGWGEQKGYAYPAGFGMRPIAETFYSIAAVPSCEELLVDITVYRSGDLSQTSHIGVMINGDNENIQNVSFSTDESSQILPVPVNMTNLQDEEIVIKLIKSDEVHLGSPSSLLITVNDNGTIEVNSSVAVTPTHCTMTKYTSSLILTGISSTVISTTIEPSSSPVSVGLSLIITTVMIGLTTVLFMISIIILATLSVYALYHNKAMAKNSNRGIDNAMYGVHEPPQAKK